MGANTICPTCPRHGTGSSLCSPFIVFIQIMQYLYTSQCWETHGMSIWLYYLFVSLDMLSSLLAVSNGTSRFQQISNKYHSVSLLYSFSWLHCSSKFRYMHRISGLPVITNADPCMLLLDSLVNIFPYPCFNYPYSLFDQT